MMPSPGREEYAEADWTGMLFLNQMFQMEILTAEATEIGGRLQTLDLSLILGFAAY